tara:strand:+ start:21530 stop:22033 length:504 start_codon:yes stop_codon:yes gene_type:complete
MGKLKNFKEFNINENIVTCNIEDLYKSVLKFVNTQLNFPEDKIKVELNHDEDQVLITYNYPINYQWNNLSDENIIKKLQNSKFESYFNDGFKDFCNKGIRGAVGMFKSDNNMTNIITTSKLDMVKNDIVFRYTQDKVEELMDINNYTNDIGKDNLNIVYIEVGIFIQ